MIRVLYVSGTAASGGSCRSLRFLIQAFPPGAVEAHLASPDGPAVEEFRRAGATIHPIPASAFFANTAGGPLKGRRWLTLLRTLWHRRHGGALRRAIEASRPDLVHVNEWGLLHAVGIARRANLPVVLHARSVQDRGNGWAVRHAEDFIERNVGVLVSIDESVRRSFATPSRTAVVYNPLPDLAAREAPAPEPGRVRVTFLAGLMAAKGVDELLDCALRLRERKDVVFTVYGRNPRPPEFYRSFGGRLSRLFGFARDAEAELRARIDGEGLGDTVRLGGHVDPAGVFATTDILLFPSRMNGVGRSVFEAGVHGIPSVVTLKDRVEDIVEDGRTGLLVPERDAAALAEALRRLADDPGLRRRLGEAAREKYVKQFDPAVAAERMLGLYRGLLGR